MVTFHQKQLWPFVINKMKLLLLVRTLHVILVVAQEYCEEKDIRITNTNATKTGNTYSIAGVLQIRMCWQSVGYCLSASVES